MAGIKEMGGSLACEPAMLAGEWAGRFGKEGGQCPMCDAGTPRQMKYCCNEDNVTVCTGFHPIGGSYRFTR